MISLSKRAAPRGTGGAALAVWFSRAVTLASPPGKDGGDDRAPGHGERYAVDGCRRALEARGRLSAPREPEHRGEVRRHGGTCRPPRRCPRGGAGPRSRATRNGSRASSRPRGSSATPPGGSTTGWSPSAATPARTPPRGGSSTSPGSPGRRRAERGHLELEWAPGTRQVDFGNLRAAAGGRALDPRLPVATLPHSNDPQCAALMSQRPGGRARPPSPSWRSGRGSAPRSRWGTWRATSRRRGPAARPRSARRRSGAARRRRPRPSAATTRPTGRGAVRTPSRTYSVHLFVRTPPSEKPPLWSSLTIQRPSPVIFMAI